MKKIKLEIKAPMSNSKALANEDSLFVPPGTGVGDSMTANGGQRTSLQP